MASEPLTDIPRRNSDMFLHWWGNRLIQRCREVVDTRQQDSTVFTLTLTLADVRLLLHALTFATGFLAARFDPMRWHKEPVPPDFDTMYRCEFSKGVQIDSKEGSARRR